MSAANFAPYQPPPDERQRALAASASAAHTGTPSSSGSRSPMPGGGSSASGAGRQAAAAQTAPGKYNGTSNAEKQSLIGSARPSSYDDEDDYDPRYATESYQSGMPQQGARGSGSSLAQPAWAQPQPQRPYMPMGPPPGSAPEHLLNFSTSQGWNLSNLCFAAWGLPPFSSVMLLIYETENDLVRFHAYQAGILGVAGITLLWILRSWFGWKSFSIVVGMALLGYSWVCGSNAANAAPTLARSPYLPFFGPLAEQWVGDE